MLQGGGHGLETVTRDGWVHLLRPRINATFHAPDLSETLSLKIGGGIQAGFPLVIHDHKECIPLPLREHHLHGFLRHVSGCFQVNRIPFFAGADVDKVAWGIRLQGSFHLGGRHPKLKVLIVALFDAIDDFLRMNAIITLTSSFSVSSAWKAQLEQPPM